MTAEQPTIAATSIGFRGMNLGDWDRRLGPVYGGVPWPSVLEWRLDPAARLTVN